MIVSCVYSSDGSAKLKVLTALFVEVPNPSISWIYASIGCQHTLQPTASDFDPPSVPALTTKGFVRWQSIEILLGPEEHVPFIQNAVRDFGIKHPDTGVLFPHPVPKEAFPLIPDSEIEKWHDQCAQELRKRATPPETVPEEREVRPEMPPRPKVKATYVHVQPSRPTMRAETEYFPRTSRDGVPGAGPRPFYQHVHSATGHPVRPVLSRSPSHRARQFLAPEDDIIGARPIPRNRRRSYPDNVNLSPINSPTNGMPEPVRSPMEESPRARRHSHPRQARRGSVSSDASSSGDGETPPSPNSTTRRRRIRRKDYGRPPEQPGVRYAVPPHQPPMDDPRLRSRDRGRTAEEQEMLNDKRRSTPIPIPVDLGGKLSAPFLLGKRERASRTARSSSRNGNLRWQDLDGPDLWRSSGGNTEEDERAEFKRRERGRDSLSGRDGTGSGRSDREREAGFSDRRRERDRRYGSPLRGVDGRRYPGN